MVKSNYRINECGPTQELALQQADTEVGKLEEKLEDLGVTKSKLLIVSRDYSTTYKGVSEIPSILKDPVTISGNSFPDVEKKADKELKEFSQYYLPDTHQVTYNLKLTKQQEKALTKRQTPAGRDPIRNSVYVSLAELL